MTKDPNVAEKNICEAINELESVRVDFERLEKIRDDKSLQLSKALREYRESLDMKGITLADYLDIPRAFLHQLETGKRRITRPTSEKIIKFLTANNVR